VRNPPAGLTGGQPGKPGLVLKNGEPIQPRVWNKVLKGDVVTVAPPGGGGYGDRFARDPLSVLEDVENEIVSRQAARDDYGVVITESLAIDWDATEALRSHMRGV